MKKFWSWVKAFFSETRVIRPTGEVSFDIKWANYDVEYLDTSIGVSNRGVELGGLALPAIDQEPPDAVEEQIRLEVATRVTNTRQQVSQRVAALNVAVSGNQINTIRSAIVLSEAQRVNDVERHRSDLERLHTSQLEELGPAQRERIDLLNLEHERTVKELEGDSSRQEEKLPDFRRAIAEYKKRYSVERNPDLVPQYKRNMGLMVLGGFTLLQATSNAILLGDLVVQGLLLSMIYALIIGFVDLFVHWNLGREGSALQAPDLFSRFKGYLCSAFFLAWIPAWNLGVVHLRRIAQLYPGEGFTRWWESFTGSMFSLTDPIAIVLLIFGIACSLIAFTSGFTWNECIPCFFKNQSRIDEIEAELFDLRGEIDDTEAEHRQGMARLTNDLTEERHQLTARQADEMSNAEETFMKEQIRQLSEQEDKAKDLMRDMETHLRLIENLEERLSQEEDLANTGFVSLVQRYRTKNREARQQTDQAMPPAYFNSSPSLDLLVRPNFVETVKTKVKESEKQYDEIQAMVQRYTAELEQVLPVIQQRRMDQFMGETDE